MKKTRKNLRAKARAQKSLTVWFSAAVPVLLAGAEALKDQLPALGELLTGWRLVAASVAVSIVVAWLRVRSIECHDDKHDGEVQ